MMTEVADALSIGLYILPIVYFRFERLTQHYTGLFLMLVVLVMVRYLLRRGFPKHDAFVRPCERSGECPSPVYAGGMPSGHMAATVYTFASLYIAAPSLMSASLLIVSGMVMGESRFRKRYHTLPQIILGAMAGWTTALIVKAQIK
jgi:membrane-associated phospholipid phosphatase